jgi:tetratricopeptide (TPR) repeat protein
MRLCAMTLVPLLLLGCVELGLRFCGFGHPTSFFLPARIDRTDFLVTNERFGFRFFPPAQARTPLFLRMRADKPAHCFRIFLFGESAAWGDPDPTFGVGRYLKVLLQERFPGTDFEVVCVAMTAINSHVIVPIARECARHHGDLWIVYMGHNEMVGPFGAATVFGARAPSLGLVRASLAVKTTRIGQLLDDLTGRLTGAAAGGKSWGGLEMFRKNQLRYDEAARLRAYGHFRRNLEDILRAGKASGVPIILSTMASNLKDCAPFASGYSTSLNDQEKATMQTLCREAIGFEASGAYAEAIGRYMQTTSIDPRVSDVRFRLGACYFASSNFDQALREFELARDYDKLAFRADTRINQVIKDTAARFAGEGVYLVDAAGTLARNSPGGIPGQELFYEHVHLHFAGNYQLARAFAEEVVPRLPGSFAARDQHAWASAESCDRRLAATVWDKYRLWQTNLRRLLNPPFTDQADHGLQVKRYQAILKELESKINTETLDQARKLYAEAVAAAPDDYLLHANYAQFLEAQADLPQALKEQKYCRALLPQVSVTYYKIGRILLQQGRFSEAAESLSCGIALGSDSLEAHLDLALALEKAGSLDQALAEFRATLCLDPTNEVARQHIAELRMSQNRKP